MCRRQRRSGFIAFPEEPEHLEKKQGFFSFFMVYCLSHYSGNTTIITVFLVDMLQFF
jgi:hypothetical protein